MHRTWDIQVRRAGRERHGRHLGRLAREVAVAAGVLCDHSDGIRGEVQVVLCVVVVEYVS
jgi:hypothetical protein